MPTKISEGVRDHEGMGFLALKSYQQTSQICDRILENNPYGCILYITYL